MKYYIALLLTVSVSISCFSQDYKSQITAYQDKYKNDFLTDENSPLKKDDLQFLRFYDADSTYRVLAHVEMQPNAAAFIIPTFNGAGQEYIAYALLKFTIKGKPQQLTIYRSTRLSKVPQYADYLFLPFTDETNGKETYGGGRYIDMRTGGFKNGTVIIDFNKAYNPYCAYSSGYSCPKPPGENNLSVAIPAGEKIYGKQH
jgi:uncharacterized protein